jgi:site-specific DNA-methyltransferase (adenine-specific)
MPISEMYFGDCKDYMKNFDDNFFDLAIPDPPYGINATKMQMGSAPNRKGKNQYPGISTAVKVRGRLNSGSGKLKNRILNSTEIEWDNEIPDTEYFELLFRVSKNQVIWGGNYFPLPPTRGIVCWDKMQPWENFSQWEMAWTSMDIPAIMIRQSNTGGRNEEKKIHPTQKPVEMYKQLLKRIAKPDMSIFDSHAGSQSLRIACYEMGFDFYGCEISKTHYDDGCKRFEEFMTIQDEVEKLGYAKTKLQQVNQVLF